MLRNINNDSKSFNLRTDGARIAKLYRMNQGIVSRFLAEEKGAGNLSGLTNMQVHELIADKLSYPIPEE